MMVYHGKKDLIIQFIKFNIIGIINTIITYLIFSFLFFLTKNYFVSLAADYIFGIVFSFYMNKNITFKVAGSASVKMFFRMIFSYAFVFVLNLVILKVLIDILFINGYLSQMIAQVFLMFAGFVVQKVYVFSHHPAVSSS